MMGNGNCSFFWWYRYRYRKLLVPEKSLGTGIEKNWYRKKSRNRSRNNLVPKKVSESVSKKFGTKKNIGTSLEIFQNICVDLGPGLVLFPGFLQFFDAIGTGLEENLVPKKVSEPVSKKMSTEKKTWNRSRRILVPKKVSESVSKKFCTKKKSRNWYCSDFGSRHTL